VSTRLEYYQQLVTELYSVCEKNLAHDNMHSDDGKDSLMAMLNQLRSDYGKTEHYIALGQQIINHIIAHYPAITPLMHRDLLWHVAGDCLHFLSDEEMQRYQDLEERYYELSQSDEQVSYSNLRAQLLGLH
jgi:hypothetical protein